MRGIPERASPASVIDVDIEMEGDGEGSDFELGLGEDEDEMGHVAETAGVEEL